MIVFRQIAIAPEEMFFSLRLICIKSPIIDCPIVLSEDFVAVDDDNVYSPKYGKDILEFVQCSKNITEADSEDENEMNNAAPVPTSSEMRNVMKNMRLFRRPIPLGK
ncbi:hypothetical protein TNCV_4667901 [Trichonephila clavipes]|nr:hypothetical protein TNCV_4667901 [Trichonephila clavipes]